MAFGFQKEQEEKLIEEIANRIIVSNPALRMIYNMLDGYIY